MAEQSSTFYEDFIITSDAESKTLILGNKINTGLIKVFSTCQVAKPIIRLIK